MLLIRPVSKWENGIALPDVTLLLALSQLFSVNMEALLTDAPADSAQTVTAPKEIASETVPATPRI